MTRVIASLPAMQGQALRWRRRGRSVGFVPTMGALHDGHLSLVQRARRENDIVVVSIFVNPAQFGPQEDLKKYPRPFKRDAALCRKAGVDVLFHPSPAGMYPPGFQTWVTVQNIAKPLEGEHRPGHFRGVATVVAKLFGIVQPTRAYFGKKDFQQLKVIERMAADLNLPVKIIPCPTVREAGGLARSSRNVYLSLEERLAANGVRAALRAGAELVKSKKPASPTEIERSVRSKLKRIPGARVQYARLVDPQTFGAPKRVKDDALLAAAVYFGRTRLIDNILIKR